jgi:hypothetical protein
MILTYPATLVGVRLKWGAKGTPEASSDRPVAVDVSVQVPVKEIVSDEQLRNALESLTAMGVGLDFGDSHNP